MQNVKNFRTLDNFEKMIEMKERHYRLHHIINLSNKLGLSCAKLRSAQASYQLAYVVLVVAESRRRQTTGEVIIPWGLVKVPDAMFLFSFTIHVYCIKQMNSKKIYDQHQ